MNRICLVIPSLGPGGMERVMSILAGHFERKENTEVHLILYARKRETFYDIHEKINIHKPDFEFNNKIRVAHTLKTAIFLRKKINEISPDVILSFGEEWNIFVLISLLGVKKRIFVADRAEPGLKRNRLYTLLSQWLYKSTAGIIVQTERAKSIYQEYHKHNNIISIGNPIRCINSFPIEKENIILSVGRLVKSKNFDLLIKIFSRVNDGNWKLIIVGGDAQQQNEMENLKKLIRDQDLEGNVVLTGTVSNVDEYYNRSKIFAFTSSSEGFPNVLGEAMAARLPVIAFDCKAGPSDLIKDKENGFLIPLFDNEQFKKNLRLLMENENLRERMGKKSSELIQKFSTDIIAEKYFSFITSVK